MDHSDQALQWDIFCKVIDNFGDIGICWRLAADLASRGQRVRLWIDDASALTWMAPDGQTGVSVLAWDDEPAGAELALVGGFPTDVLVETFGCDVPCWFMTACAEQAAINGKNPVWINLEYLSAEPYAERNHGLPSHVTVGPAAGWEKWFFYPGFTPRTGGLLREKNLATRQKAFVRDDWLNKLGMDWQGKALVSLFCYEPPALDALLQQFAAQGLDGKPVHLLVAEGRARSAVQALQQPPTSGQLAITYLPLLAQTDFDHLLWACDLNLVRGEDSIVRALWAGKPFVWQIYPQDDGVHSIKLDAFLDTIDAPTGLRNFHHAWNAGAGESASGSLVIGMQAWQTCASRIKNRLMAMPDLTTNLLEFVHKNR
ncbi:MAG: elongation factor P maturation arginine rhamnosyltransferase EarP [Pseudomonadota bacterium]